MFKHLFNKELNPNLKEDIEDLYDRNETLNEDALTDMDFMDIYSDRDEEKGEKSSSRTINHEYNDVGYIEESNIDLFNDVYANDEDESNVQDTIEIEDKQFKNVLKHLSRRGYTITFTGNHGCGTTTIACNTAYTLCKLGFKTLLLDLDTIRRNQH